MSGETTSPNMNLILPGVSITGSPTWAQDVNASLILIDQHDHSPGYGVQITPSGMNISSDLTFLSNNAIALRSARFTAQSAVLSLSTDLDCLYVVGVDLYYNDGNGNHVRITQSGGVAGSPGSISNLTSPASASYVSANQTFVWQSAANTPANMDFASAIFRNLSASSKGLTLNPPASMASDYSLTLPTLPAANNTFLQVQLDGTISSALVVDNSTIAISSNQLIVKSAGITATQLASSSVTTNKIADGSVTRPKLSALGQQVSSSSGGYTSSSASYADVTNLSVTITTTGRPVYVAMIPFQASSGAEAACGGRVVSSSSIAINLRMTRDGNQFCETRVEGYNLTGGLGACVNSFIFTDVVSAGTYNYKIQAKGDGGYNVEVHNFQLIAYEL